MAIAIDPVITMDHPVVKTVQCSGSPYNIGFQHGSSVSKEVHSNVATYTFFFKETAKITWTQAREKAATLFLPVLHEKYPEILEEMKGLAEGAGGGLTTEDILALNVRSEIALTNYADGCTCISQTSADGQAVYVVQNWDWLEELDKGMVFLDIRPAGSSIRIQFLSEAGIVGKIGMNSTGFGFCSNALRSGALNPGNFPVHIMSRRLLQYATSYDHAISIIEEFGLASTTNYMLADSSGKHADIECSPYGNTIIKPHNEYQYVAHTNHLYAPNRPAKVIDHPAANSFDRLARIQQLTDIDGKAGVLTTFETLKARLSDQQGTPYSICRDRPPGAIGMERMTTLSTIMMELKSRTGRVTIGRPCDELPVVQWKF